jgi:hypothetical protein
MEKKENAGLQENQKVQGVWERRTEDRRLGQNQLFGSFRVDSGAKTLSQSDPTDNVLAAIASILDNPTERPTDKPLLKVVDEPPIANAETKPPIPTSEAVPIVSEPPPSAAADLESYVKLGPGPLDALRFKWTVRPAGDGNYFVDETIGDGSRAMTSSPMPREQAIRFIDEREHDARRRFEALKNQMIGQAASTTNPARPDPGEA